MIRLSQVTFSYAPDACPVITGLSTVFDASTHTVVAGPDGSGKTTLAKLIKGSLAPTSGEIATDVDRTTEIGYVGQDPNDFIVGATIEEDVVFGLENIGASRSEMRHRLELALDRTGLSGMENRLTHSLSGGELQRLALAGWTAMGCRALILDEALSMLDRRARADIWTLLRNLRNETGTAVIEITNAVERVLSADRVLFLNGGSITFEGSPHAFLVDETGREWARLSGGLGSLTAELLDRDTPLPQLDGTEDLLRLLLNLIHKKLR